MKRILLLNVFIAITGWLQAQNASAVFFTENGEPFTLIMNGLRKNDKPETNVRISGLNEVPYTVKIIFADTALGVLTDKIYAANYKERTYVIKSKPISSASKGLKKASVNIGRQLKSGDKEEAAKQKEEIDNTDSKYVVKLLSEANMDAPSGSGSSNSGTGGVQNNSTAVNSGITTQTTTTTTTKGTANGSGTSVNIGASGSENSAQFSMNVNIGGSTGGNTQQTQTTTHTQTDHYVMPGYSGTVGCPWPMAPNDFESAKRSIAEKSFEDSKLTIAKQIIGSNCIISSQVKEIMMLFNFEETRLDFAKYAYKYTYDINNYYKVNDAFTFESSIEELNEHIERIKN